MSVLICFSLSPLYRDCVRRALREHINLQKLNIYVSHDCTGEHSRERGGRIPPYHYCYHCPLLPPLLVYVTDVYDIFESDQDQSLLVLVPVRLGSESLNPIYIPCVKVSRLFLVLIIN